MVVSTNAYEAFGSDYWRQQAAALADFSEDSVIACDAAGCIALWNKGAETLYGFSSSQAEGKPLHELLSTRHPFGLPRIQAELTRDDKWVGEIFRRHESGAELFISAKAKILRDKQGQVLSFLESSRSKERAEQIEDDATGIAHRYRNLFHAMAAGFWELDFTEVRRLIGALRDDGVTDIRAYFEEHPTFIDRCIESVRVIDVNDMTVSMFGAPSRDAILSKSIGWAWLPESRGIFAASLVAAGAQQDKFMSEVRLGRWDGSTLDALFTVCWPVKARGSILVGVIDISDRVAAFREVEESEGRYRSLFDHMPVGLIQLDNRSQLAWLKSLKEEGVEDLAAHFRANPAAFERSGELVRISAANPEAVRLFRANEEADLLGPVANLWTLSANDFQAAVLARLRGEPTFSTETRLVRKDGTVLEALFKLAFAPEMDARGFSIVGLTDIGPQKEAAAALAESENRYRTLFEYMPIGICELDTGRQLAELSKLREKGIRDANLYLQDHPEFVERLSELVTIKNANTAALKILEAQNLDDVQGPISRVWGNSLGTLGRVAAARLAGEHSFAEDTSVTTVSGHNKDALVTIAFPPALDARGISVAGFLDITEQKRARTVIEASEARFRNLFINMPVGLVQIDMDEVLAWYRELADTPDELAALIEADLNLSVELSKRIRIQECNPEGLRLFGASSNAEIHETIEPYWRLRPDTLQRSTLARLRGETTYSEETQIMNHQGEAVDVLYTIGYPPGLVERGINVVGFVDLSERRRATNALRLSEGRYHDLFQQIPIALWRLNPERIFVYLSELRASGVADLGDHFESHPEALTRCMQALTIVECNAAAARIVGAENPKDLVGRDITFLWQDYPEMFRNCMVAYWRGQKRFAEEGLMGTLGKEPAHVAFAIAYPTAVGDVSVISTMDIGDRRRAERRLQEMQADLSHSARVSTLGELAASIAHEVKQPLAAISACAQATVRWLSRADPDLTELRHLSKQIISDTTRASDIISRIRGMALKVDPSFTLLDMNELIEEALLIVGHEAESRSIRVTKQLAAELPPVLGDRIQLQQIIVNLALNAAQAMSAAQSRNKLISVTSELRDDMLFVSVADTGPGISPEALDHLFTGFFTTKETGMGMGLAICRSILEAHGGLITASNRDVGACFTFSLPVTRGH